MQDSLKNLQNFFKKTIDKIMKIGYNIGVPKGKGRKNKAQRRTRKKEKRKMKKVLDKLPKVWYNEYVPKRNKRKLRLRLTAKMKGTYYD